MPTRHLDAAALGRVERAAYATRNLDPELRQALDFAYHGDVPGPEMTERLIAEPMAWDYAPDTMWELSHP